MKVGDRVHGRFEVIEAPLRSDEVVLRDRETGQRALSLQPRYFLDEASSFAMASHVRALADPALAEVLALNPTVLALGEDEGSPTAAELARLTLDLMERCLGLLEEGVVAQPRHAWVVRAEDGWRFRLPAGLVGVYGLNFDNRPFLQRWPVESVLIEGCLGFFDRRVPGKAGHARDAETAVATLAVWDEGLRGRSIPRPRRVWQRLDLDDAERRGRAARERGSKRSEYVDWPLAAVIHHRACVAASAGDRSLALALVDEALTLDRHARYLTTRALLLEALGRDEEARVAHEQAVDALPQSFLTTSSEEIRIIDGSESMHDARTAHAHGAFLARRGELEAALPWLRVGRGRHPWFGHDRFAASRHGALAVVLLRLHRDDEARAAATAALGIDAAEPSALAVMVRLG